MLMVLAKKEIRYCVDWKTLCYFELFGYKVIFITALFNKRIKNEVENVSCFVN